MTYPHDPHLARLPESYPWPAFEPLCGALEPRSSYLDIAGTLIKALRDQDERLTKIEALLMDEAESHTDPDRFFTVRRYAGLHDLRLSITQVKELDRCAAKFCRMLGIRTGRAHDNLFGEVNSYHFEALDDVYAEWSKGGAL